MLEPKEHEHEEDELQALPEESELLPPPAVPLAITEAFGSIPLEIWSRIAFFLDPSTLCRAELAASVCHQLRATEAEIWKTFCENEFPTMHASVIASLRGERLHDQHASNTGTKHPRRPRRHQEHQSSQPADDALRISFVPPSRKIDDASDWPSVTSDSHGACHIRPAFACTSTDQTPTFVDWRELYIKRRAKKAQWNVAKYRRERTTSSFSDESASLGSACSSAHASPQLGARASPKCFSELTQRELGRLSDAANRLRTCANCGEKFSPGEARLQPEGCCFHPGDFLPILIAGWSGPELKQLRQTARQALRSAGGSSWIKRHPRGSKGRGHWLKGLGALANNKEKILHCLTGESSAAWSCCSAGSLFSEGCQHGMHRA